MSEHYVVILTEARGTFAYGPTEDKEIAESFAEFLTKEVDPAVAVSLRSPTAELLAWWRQFREATIVVPPEHWPPSPGQVWSDRDGDRWICLPMATHKPYLACLAKQRDDSAEEVLRRYGPLKFKQIVTTTDEEVPF